MKPTSLRTKPSHGYHIRKLLMLNAGPCHCHAEHRFLAAKATRSSRDSSYIWLRTHASNLRDTQSLEIITRACASFACQVAAEVAPKAPAVPHAATAFLHSSAPACLKLRLPFTHSRATRCGVLPDVSQGLDIGNIFEACALLFVVSIWKVWCADIPCILRKTSQSNLPHKGLLRYLATAKWCPVSPEVVSGAGTLVMLVASSWVGSRISAILSLCELWSWASKCFQEP